MRSVRSTSCVPETLAEPSEPLFTSTLTLKLPVDLGVQVMLLPSICPPVKVQPIPGGVLEGPVTISIPVLPSFLTVKSGIDAAYAVPVNAKPSAINNARSSFIPTTNWTREYAYAPFQVFKDQFTLKPFETIDGRRADAVGGVCNYFDGYPLDVLLKNNRGVCTRV